MKAVVYDRYGPSDVLRLEEVDKPVPQDDEVLVKVHATTVTRTDAGLRSADKKVKMGFPRYTKENLLYVKQLIEAGKYRAVIDRRYPLEDVVKATRYVETGQKTGNVVLTVASDHAI